MCNSASRVKQAGNELEMCRRERVLVCFGFEDQYEVQSGRDVWELQNSWGILRGPEERKSCREMNSIFQLRGERTTFRASVALLRGFSAVLPSNLPVPGRMSLMELLHNEAAAQLDASFPPSERAFGALILLQVTILL